MTQYRHLDTKRADGVYVSFERIEHVDQDATPLDYLFQDEEYRKQDQERLDAWRRGDWHFVGIQARAHILVVRNGVGTIHELTSAGLWGTESDSEAEHFGQIYEDEKAELLEDIKALGSLPINVE